MFWIILAFIVPIFVAWKGGSSYAFAFSLVGAGVLMYFVNIFLIRHFIVRRAPHTILSDAWETTAGMGVVPRWVSVIGLIGTGLVPSGAAVAVLLFAEVIVNRS